jgi:hypothetical protein
MACTQDSDGRSLWEAGGHPGFLRVEDYALHWYIHVEAGWKVCVHRIQHAAPSCNASVSKLGMRSDTDNSC